MANILGRERRKIKELKAELVRKDQIIMELVEKAPDPWRPPTFNYLWTYFQF